MDADLARRLAHGAKQRAEMQAQLERGEQPTGVRAAWLCDSARLVITVLAERCDAFNRENPEQAASLADALDALASARAMLLALAANHIQQEDRTV